jgi:hypothetical protein
MTFEGQYLTYAEYIALGGSAIGETPFNLLEFEARKQIDVRTQRRLIDQTTIPNQVKLCDYHLMNTIDKYAKKQAEINGNIASESIDGYSVTYLTADQIEQVVKLHDNELNDIMLDDLYGVVVDGVAILYPGVI